uniref:Uncharacterized protein n=1 Tax=Alexandrium catenella TaxID=2925 RepID=A0A7S1RNS6_ALECA
MRTSLRDGTKKLSMRRGWYRRGGIITWSREGHGGDVVVVLVDVLASLLVGAGEGAQEVEHVVLQLAGGDRGEVAQQRGSRVEDREALGGAVVDDALPLQGASSFLEALEVGA